MYLELENVAKIKVAKIHFNGITVLAGKNSTGKSTIGKVLYCMFNAFYNIDEKIYKERISAIERILIKSYNSENERMLRRRRFNDSAKQIVDNSEIYKQNITKLIEDIAIIYKEKNINFDINLEPINVIVNEIINHLHVTDNEVKKIVFGRFIDSEFGMQVNHVNDISKIANIVLKIKNNEIKVNIAKNVNINIDDQININTEAVYIDDPFILNRIDNFYYKTNHHQDILMENLMGSTDRVKEQGVFEEAVSINKLTKIMEKINIASGGEIYKTSENEIEFKESGLNIPINLSNISAGIKTFLIIRLLLQNGTLSQGGMLVLDEPEIHLHPEWQLLFAEIIILLQTEFNMNILINTHSPYFLNAIEVYAAKYKISDKCKYYLAENVEDYAIIRDVSDEIEEIYTKLSIPFQTLENVRYSDD